MNTSKINSPWVLIEISKVVYAISCESVLSLSQVPETTSLPKAPKEVRGVIEFRDKMIELVDTRLLLGLNSIFTDIEEFSKIIDQRYEDHKNWVTELEKSVIGGYEFTLTTDPHQCAFGKWYDTYVPENANIMFLSTFSKFDTPHKAIHQIGVTAKNLVDRGKSDEAIELINSVRETELQQMFHLFADLKQAYNDSKREIVVVMGNDEKCVGLSVDQIASIEHLSEIDEDFIKESVTDSEYLAGVAKRKDDSVVFLLNDEYILSKYH